MRILFFGSGEFGLPTLQRLCAEHEVMAVITQPDRPAGRKQKLTPTPIGQWAEANGLTVQKAEDVNTDAFVAQVRAYQPEASVVIAFGQKLSSALIDAMGKLAVNLHASLLPKFRGAAPINWAMIRGERRTGVSVIGLAQRMDAGLIYATEALDIDPEETAGELHDRLAKLGPDAVCRVLHDLAHDSLDPVEQDEAQATKAPKLRKGDGTVDFALPADAVRCRVHGLTPWPGCRVRWRPTAGGDGGMLMLRRLRVGKPRPAGLEPGTVGEGGAVAAEDAWVQLLEVQAPGGKPMPIDAFLRGHALRPGDRLEPWTPD
jgi:methionyl-tRNA formyltransferase